VRDLIVHPRDNDLVIATHARGFYILDDVTPMQELARDGISDKMVLFPPMCATRYTPASDTSTIGDNVFTARNKPYGALISYYLTDHPSLSAEAKIDILDSDGKVIQTINGTQCKGLNRVVWNLRENSLGDEHKGKPVPWFDSKRDGPRVLPGDYVVRLSALGQIKEQPLKVQLDPRVQISRKDLDAYGNAVKQLVKMQYEVGASLYKIRKIEQQILKLDKQLTDAKLKNRAKRIRKELAAIRNKLQPSRRTPINLNLKGRISWILRQVRNYTGRPTQAQRQWITKFDKQLQQALRELNDVIKTRLAEFNRHLRQAGISHIVIDIM